MLARIQIRQPRVEGSELLGNLLDVVVVLNGPPAELFSDPKEERTQRFLERVIAAGRL